MAGESKPRFVIVGISYAGLCFYLIQPKSTVQDNLRHGYCSACVSISCLRGLFIVSSHFKKDTLLTFVLLVSPKSYEDESALSLMTSEAAGRKKGNKWIFFPIRKLFKI